MFWLLLLDFVVCVILLFYCLVVVFSCFVVFSVVSFILSCLLCCVSGCFVGCAYWWFGLRLLLWTWLVALIVLVLHIIL